MKIKVSLCFFNSFKLSVLCDTFLLLSAKFRMKFFKQDGARYDRNGNRIKYANANANANADRRSEQAEPEPELVVVDLPRQKFNYQKPSNPEVSYQQSSPGKDFIHPFWHRAQNFAPPNF